MTEKEGRTIVAAVSTRAKTRVRTENPRPAMIAMWTNLKMSGSRSFEILPNYDTCIYLVDVHGVLVSINRGDYEAAPEYNSVKASVGWQSI